ncbi:Deoxythymidylate kinase (Thymidylate kinase) [Paragonimus heterotremus]|uniref:dTMP kinase n=1 Tax=Paragonimus heterotremus TaxID=100268 RepID=A0A8J4SNJ2_9TREM|nr:Deoxythymidylate kinase (Thymidylate kinase) [Paragonimus heterotremus]
MSVPQESPGIFVAIEGADRTGKSTQSSLLADALSKLTGKKTLLLKFPDRDTALGHHLNDYLLGDHNIDSHALHLLFTANRWEKQDELRNALSSGISVVADRYSYSGIAYTSAKSPPTPSWQWCCDMEKGLVEPDLVICLTPERFDHLKERNGYGTERYETDDFQQRVLENYIRLSKDAKYADYSELDAEDHPHHEPSQFWHFVQATNKTVEEVHECIMAIVQMKLKSMQVPEISDRVD